MLAERSRAGRRPDRSPVLNLRSVGVQDMRFGYCVEDDWGDAQPGEFLRDRCTEVPFLPHAAFYFVGATLTEQAHHPVGRLVGDLLVQFSSASGQGRRRRIPFEVGNGAHLGKGLSGQGPWPLSGGSAAAGRQQARRRAGGPSRRG